MIILPKEHADNLFSLSDETGSKLLPVAKKVAKAVKEVTGCDGINIMQNNGTAAGQSVFHFHMHVVPRYDGDGILPVWPQGSYADGEAAELAAKISEKI